MTPQRKPPDWNANPSGGQVSGVQENTLPTAAKAEMPAKAQAIQATSSEAGKVCVEDDQSDLDAIARMASEGGLSSKNGDA